MRCDTALRHAVVRARGMAFASRYNFVSLQGRGGGGGGGGCDTTPMRHDTAPKRCDTVHDMAIKLCPARYDTAPNAWRERGLGAMRAA